jgi:hypothetical protein
MLTDCPDFHNFNFHCPRFIIMGAHESTLVSDALYVAYAKVQAERNINIEISEPVRLTCSLTLDRS